MKTKVKKSAGDKPVTMNLLFEFTDEVLLPRMSDLMDDKLDKRFAQLDLELDKRFAQQNYELKDYIDKKLADYTSDIFRRLEKRDIHDKHFKVKVVELFKKHRIGTEKELAFLEGLVSGA